MPETRFYNSFYAKVIFGAIVGFAAIVLGIYVGYAIIGPDQSFTPTKDQWENAYDSLDEQYVSFTDGDLFPLEPYWDENGNEHSFEQLLKGKPTILLFMSIGCGPCKDMLSFWNGGVDARLADNVQVVACIRKDSGPIPSDYKDLLSNKTVAFFDGSRWNNVYDMAFWPTIVGVDNSGFVNHVQIGFDNKIDGEFKRLFYKRDNP